MFVARGSTLAGPYVIWGGHIAVVLVAGKARLAGERVVAMNVSPFQDGRSGMVGPGNPQAETAIAMLGTLPLGVLAVESIVGFILLMISVVFFATIFFAFVGLFLLYIALWLAVLFNGFGVFVSLLTLAGGWRYTTGRVFGATGVIIHAVLLVAAVYVLVVIHSNLGVGQRVSINSPAVYVQVTAEDELTHRQKEQSGRASPEVRPEEPAADPA
jgi:hypothetical protein